MTGKVVATFDSPVTAELAHNYLAEHGLHPLLQNEGTMAVFSSMSNLVGGVKLLVPDDEEMAAKDLLANLPKLEDDPDSSEAIVPAGLRVDADPDSLAETTVDADCRRAFRTMVLGLIPPLWPVQLYGLYLLTQIGKSGERLSPRYRWTPLWCILLFLPLWGAVGLGAATFFNAFDDPAAPHWQAATLDFSKDYAMGVELPGPYRSETFRKETPIGPMRHSSLRAMQGDCLYWATADAPIESSPEAEKDETIEAIVTAAAEVNHLTVTGKKWIEHRGHTGLEYRTKGVNRNGTTLHGRAQMFRVGDRFLEIGLMGANAADTDDFRARRFFATVRIP
jgi:Putative prokaryotic signal transducing protein